MRAPDAPDIACYRRPPAWNTRTGPPHGGPGEHAFPTSRPGGTDFDAARRLGHRAIHALSLPAACAPETAGEAVAQTVCDMIGQREEAS